ncbi:hypothetical protein OKW38_000844 [Paraburkholderia sp. MM5496-R1]
MHAGFPGQQGIDLVILGQQLGRRTRMNDRFALEHHGVVRDAQRLARVLLDQNH